ncbi:hypothetical protein V1511DRAFT_504648 [Dipodascopsis uninucleata]
MRVSNRFKLALAAVIVKRKPVDISYEDYRLSILAHIVGPEEFWKTRYNETTREAKYLREEIESLRNLLGPKAKQVERTNIAKRKADNISDEHADAKRQNREKFIECFNIVQAPITDLYYSDKSDILGVLATLLTGSYSNSKDLKDPVRILAERLSPQPTANILPLHPNIIFRHIPFIFMRLANSMSCETDKKGSTNDYELYMKLLLESTLEAIMHVTRMQFDKKISLEVSCTTCLAILGALYQIISSIVRLRKCMSTPVWNYTDKLYLTF